MKSSQYTYYYVKNGFFYIFHQISNALLEVEEDLYRALKENHVTVIPQDIQDALTAKGFLVEDDVREVDAINYANIVGRYQSKILRATIMPTMACNFSCWYCYENHHASRMTEEARDAVARFIKKEVEEKNLQSVMLDWFGGEPLLCFDNIIEPLAHEIQKWCEEKDINFIHAITTNGALITPEMAERMESLRLHQFQITLDGGPEFHNKTRFSATMPDSFSVIIKNIHTLCRTLTNPDVTVRINYTVENFDSIIDILDCFEEDIRQYLEIFPHVVWQEAHLIQDAYQKVNDVKKKAVKMGYRINEGIASCRNCATCYTESMEQYLINYDLAVYKCTARDFDGKNSVGYINPDGSFVPNHRFYTFYATPSPIFHPSCQVCPLLPSCMDALNCLQKKVEGVCHACDKESIERALCDKLQRMIVNTMA